MAKEAGDDKVLGIAMWMPPRPIDQKLTWGEWLWEKLEGWKLWGNQVGMNLWYGRGGLNVKVRSYTRHGSGTPVVDQRLSSRLVSSVTTYGRLPRRLRKRSCGRILEATTSLISSQFYLQSKGKVLDELSSRR